MPVLGFRNALHLSFSHRNAQLKAVASAGARVPDGVTLEVANYLGLALSAWDTMLV